MKPTIRMILPTLLLFGLAACQQEGPAERAGRSLDKAGQSVRDTVDPPRGPVERLGRSVDRAVN
jgi:predicted small lipoprotein YifL